MAGGADPALLQDRHVDHTEDGPAVLQQRDQAAEERVAGDEALGAVDRVQDPDEFGAGILDAEFFAVDAMAGRSEEHTSELQSLMRLSYAVFCLKKKKNKKR